MMMNWYSFGKRLLDILLASLALILLLPLLLITMIVLRFTAEREVFYLQTRMARYNKTFRIWKFATMLKDSPNMGTGTITLRNDPRVTAFGRILRKTKINELPQLFNVLLGDMSIVGPRPLVPKDFDHYPAEYREIIYRSKPGLTGIGSVVFRDEQFFVSHSDLPPVEFYKRYILPYKGALEKWYYENASMGTDLLIIFLTAWVIVFPHSDMVHRVFKSLPPRPAELCRKAYKNVQISKPPQSPV